MLKAAFIALGPLMNKRVVSIGFYTIFVIFLVWYIGQLDLNRLSGIELDYQSLGVATFLAILFRYSGILTWLRILKGLGVGPLRDKGALCYVYAKAWLGRYLPGKITWIVGKVVFASAQGISTRKLVVSSAFEVPLQLAVTLFLSVVLLGIDPRLDIFSPLQKVLLISTGAGLLVAMIPSIFNRLVRLAYKRVKNRQLSVDDWISRRTLLEAAALYGTGFLLTGAAYFFFTKAIYDGVTHADFIFIAGVFNLAGAIGILSIFAPSGLGVRESIQLILLPLVIPAELALVVTIAARLWSIFVDLSFFGLTYLHQAVWARVSSLNSVDAGAKVR